MEVNLFLDPSFLPSSQEVLKAQLVSWHESKSPKPCVLRVATKSLRVDQTATFISRKDEGLICKTTVAQRTLDQVTDAIKSQPKTWPKQLFGNAENRVLLLKDHKRLSQAAQRYLIELQLEHRVTVFKLHVERSDSEGEDDGHAVQLVCDITRGLSKGARTPANPYKAPRVAKVDARTKTGLGKLWEAQWKVLRGQISKRKGAWPEGEAGPRRLRAAVKSGLYTDKVLREQFGM